MTTDQTAYSPVFVAGAGAWGTALACLTARNGVETALWCRDETAAQDIQSARVNERYLPGISLPDGMTATSDLSAAARAEAILFVVPAQFSRPVLGALREACRGSARPVALCSKGIERETGKMMTEVLEEAWPEAIPAVLSGPSFAADVARGLPTAVTLACASKEEGRRWQNAVKAPNFRPYLSEDLIGAELGGAVKNVLAIACGICDGKGYGESARAALMTRGFAEFQRLGLALGATSQSMAGLSGLGDLILTCSSRQSRNMSLGYAIGEGADPATILSSRHTVSEGAATARPLRKLARKLGVDMPICDAVAAVLEGEAKAEDLITALLNRPLKQEGE